MDDSIWRIFKKGLSHLLDSTTNTLLLLLTILAVIVVFAAAAFFRQYLFETLLLSLGINGGVSGLRSLGVDGAPKVAAAIQDPNSAAANPPPAVSEPKGVNAETTSIVTSTTSVQYPKENPL